MVVVRLPVVVRRVAPGVTGLVPTGWVPFRVPVAGTVVPGEYTVPAGVAPMGALMAPAGVAPTGVLIEPVRPRC